MTTIETPPSLGSSMDVDALRSALGAEEPELARSFATYAQEALFFRRVLADEIDALPPGSRVLEIGSGIGLLAHLIAAAGHHVVAFEPEAAGFDGVAKLARLVQDVWTDRCGEVTIHRERFTGLPDAGDPFDYAVAVNVIEHVPDPAGLVVDATAALTADGTGRFICPNYAFPYEPHFNIPTVWSRRLTRRLAGRVIRGSEIPDAEAFWDELSWPTVRSLRRRLRDAPLDAEFSRRTLRAYVDRLDEPSFVARKGRAFAALASGVAPAVRIGTRLTPIAICPVIDLTTRPTGRFPAA